MQERLNKIGSSVNSAKGNLSAFDKMEEKINKQLDEANAMAELNAPKEDSIEDIMNKYDDNNVSTSEVDDKLAGDVNFTTLPAYHAIILAKNKEGLKIFLSIFVSYIAYVMCGPIKCLTPTDHQACNLNKQIE